MVLKEDNILFTMCVISIFVNISENNLYITLPDICSLSIVLYSVSLGNKVADSGRHEYSLSLDSEIHF